MKWRITVLSRNLDDILDIFSREKRFLMPSPYTINKRNLGHILFENSMNPSVMHSLTAQPQTEQIRVADHVFQQN